MERTDIDVRDFLRGLPDDVRSDMETLDGIIHEEMHGLDRVLFTGTFWGGSHQDIIGYGTYTYRRSDGKAVEWFVVGLARQKDYTSVYISAVEDGQYLSEKYAADLGSVKVGKSAISISSIDDLDLDAFRRLVRAARGLSAEYLDEG
ncbi:MAG: DUF1801 domain-containing protein [Acidimicrobiia bacterium]|nr:DUF1801 domain-containing protein [Acidimicrobiia bacterium]